MIWIISRYNHDMEWMKDYNDYAIIYDRSEKPMQGAIVVPNVGSDIYDKFSFIIDNYDNLPDVAIYTKANIFKYITKEEFDKIKDNKTFTPILGSNHEQKMCDAGVLKSLNALSPKPFSYYKDGIYYELNWPAYLKNNPAKDQPIPITIEWYLDLELVKLLGMDKIEYLPFAPGSNYILPKENILKHSKEFYIKLRSFLGWTVYGGECMIMERGLYLLWK